MIVNLNKSLGDCVVGLIEEMAVLNYTFQIFYFH